MIVLLHKLIPEKEVLLKVVGLRQYWKFAVFFEIKNPFPSPYLENERG